MDWVALISFISVVVFGAGMWVTTIRVLKEEIIQLKVEIKTIKEHNDRQDTWLSKMDKATEVIMVNLDYIKRSLDELRQEHKTRLGCVLTEKE